MFITASEKARLQISQRRLQRKLCDALARHTPPLEKDTTELSRVTRILENADVVGPPDHVRTVAIGHDVEVNITDESGERMAEYRIVGYGESDVSTAPPSIAHDTPIAKALIGLRVGESECVELRGGRRTFEVISITIPRPDVVRRKAAVQATC